MRLQINTILAVLVLVFLFFGCNRPIELKIPSKNYSIKVINVNVSNPLVLHPNVYRDYEYERRYGSSNSCDVTEMTRVNNEIIRIRDYRGTRYELIFMRNYNNLDRMTACYIHWKNHSRGEFVSCEIDESTYQLETNIDSLIMKKMYPKLKCKITYKNYSAIKVDNSKYFLDGSFFGAIKFIE